MALLIKGGEIVTADARYRGDIFSEGGHFYIASLRFSEHPVHSTDVAIAIVHAHERRFGKRSA